MEASKLGRYAIQSELGRGAMGVVYKATDTALERTVAVKTVNMALERDGAEKYEARFYQEARAAGSPNHPNIVTVYDVGWLRLAAARASWKKRASHFSPPPRRSDER